MHILNIIQCTNLGGMEQASLRLMQAMQARGHSFEVISLNPIGGIGPRLRQSGISARGINYSKIGKVRAFLSLRREINASSADAVMMTGHNLAASLALLGAGPARKLMAMHYHHEGVMPEWRWRLIYHAACLTFRNITFPSDYVRNEAETIHPSVRKIAMTVRNPLPEALPPTEDQDNNLRVRFNIPQTAPIIGNAGWLIARKRFDVFLNTASQVRRLRPDARFVIAGDGEMRAILEAQAIELGLSDCVHFTGWLSDLEPFWNAIDVLLFNSDWDCFPTTPIEAMGRALPVVASLAHGGLSEALDESCGWLLDEHDEFTLAANVIEALGVHGEVRALHARERVLEMSDPERIASTIESLLFNGVPT